jgi:hypothetical protein
MVPFSLGTVVRNPILLMVGGVLVLSDHKVHRKFGNVLSRIQISFCLSVEEDDPGCSSIQFPR